MRAAEIRSKFLKFFEENGHEVVSSSPVVPHDDPTLMFANAGMNQFKKRFTGEEQGSYVRAATTQKCLRAGGKHNDLENVGYTARHLTFFEMLGNFSFGDYFKTEACEFAWKLITEGLEMKVEDLWVTVFEEDEEAREIWRDKVGVAADRIVSMGAADNYWSMGDVGPCGPCSEIFVDRGPKYSCGEQCGLGLCECDRFLEFWNLVFMQFEQLPDGTKQPLPKPSIDTGMGLERICMLLQNKENVFETDVLAALIEEIAKITGKPAGNPHQVIADHVRSLSFAIADGAYPSNEGRGYVLRRILRRAARYGYQLGMEEPFVWRLVSVLDREMGEAFPELRKNREFIEERIRADEESFGKTLRRGMQRFDEEVKNMQAQGSKLFSGEVAFFLHDSCGFPIDLTKQMARENNIEVDEAAYEREMGQQKDRSRQGTSFKAVGGEEGGSSIELSSDQAPTVFCGFEQFDAQCKVLAVSSDQEQVQVVLDKTPFYAEGGGQIGDTGYLQNDDFKLEISDTRKTPEGHWVHYGKLNQSKPLKGELAAIAVGSAVQAQVDVTRRRAIQRNHTATHLLHAALRQVLGDHVQQKGSLVAPDRLRFDVSHFAKISDEELKQVEQIIQDQILANTPVQTGEYSKEEALSRGAMAFFGEKYGDKVRVVEIDKFSLELCGGAHCASTGEIGSFRFTTEASVSSGVRRIEAATGLSAYEQVKSDQALLGELSSLLRIPNAELVAKVQNLLKDNKELRGGKGQANQQDLLASLDQKASSEMLGSMEFVWASWEAAPMEEILRVADSLKRKAGQRVFLLLGYDDEGVRFVVGHSSEVKKGTVHSGKLAKEGATVLGGGGGGRPDMAQAGGKDVSKIGDAVEAIKKCLLEQLS